MPSILLGTCNMSIGGSYVCVCICSTHTRMHTHTHTHTRTQTHTCEGLLLACAISVMGSAEVLEAKTQCSGVTASTSWITLCLIFRSSNTASITMSAWSKPWKWERMVRKGGEYIVKSQAHYNPAFWSIVEQESCLLNKRAEFSMALTGRAACLSFM